MKLILFIGAMLFSIIAGAADPVTIPLPNGATVWIFPVDDEDTLAISVKYDTGTGEVISPPVIVCNPTCE